MLKARVVKAHKVDYKKIYTIPMINLLTNDIRLVSSTTRDRFFSWKEDKTSIAFNLEYDYMIPGYKYPIRGMVARDCAQNYEFLEETELVKALYT